MPDVKNLMVLSDWLTFELETDWLDPPIIKLRLSPILEDAPIADVVDDRRSGITIGDITRYKIYDAIQDWDLTRKERDDEGNERDVKVPLTRHNKQVLLRSLLGLKIKGEDHLLGMKILFYARNKENFLKNSKPTLTTIKKSGTC